ncbi:MAG TPA: YggT family protein [Anaerolineales bacterium]|nr:YggT family protein [Anaerolineales bacterium]
MMNREQRVFSFKLIELIWLFFGSIDGLIGLRILLKLVAANPDNPFAAFVYGLTEVFLWPFRGLTATPSAGGYVLELPAFVALLVYALLAWGIARLVWILLYRPPDTRPPTQPRTA